MNDYLPLITLAVLGAFHGLNPAMGWLFAVALGLQERSRAAVLRAFLPIALGHAASIAIVVALVVAAQTVVDLSVVRILGAGVLVAFGLYKLLQPLSHPRWVGMQVNFRELTVWSFLMATAHGAGLMLVPILVRLSQTTAPVAHAAQHDHAAHAGHMAAMSATTVAPLLDLAAVAIHTGAMFLVMGLVAVVVFEKLGLSILRRAWFNLDSLWAGALIATGVLSFML